jgi:hypothetical protein
MVLPTWPRETSRSPISKNDTIPEGVSRISSPQRIDTVVKNHLFGIGTNRSDITTIVNTRFINRWWILLTWKIKHVIRAVALTVFSFEGKIDSIIVPFEREYNLPIRWKTNLFRHMRCKDTTVPRRFLGKIDVEEVG